MAAELRDKEAAIQPAKNSEGNKQWSDLFRSSSKPSNSFQLRKWNVDDRAIAKDELRDLGHCLIAYILGRFPGRTAVENVCKSWNVHSSCSRHETGWLIFRFQTEEDRDSVLLKGPFETFGAQWLMKKLPPFFKFDAGSLCSVPTWIRMNGLPLECWTPNALGKLASFVGVPLAADECTATMAKTSFARILVEVDVNQPLVTEVSTTLPDGSLLVQEVEYERAPQLCSKCKRVGHNEELCRMQPSNKKPRSDLQQHAKQSLAKSLARTEHTPASTVAASSVVQPSTSSGVAAQLAGKASLVGRRVQKELEGTAETTLTVASAATLTQMLQPTAGMDLLLHQPQSVAGQHEDHLARIQPDKEVQKQQVDLHGDPGTSLQDSTPRLLQANANVQPSILQGDQMITASQASEEAQQAVLETEFPPLVAGETGRKKMQTRNASAAKLAAAAKKMQHAPDLQVAAAHASAESQLGSQQHAQVSIHHASAEGQQGSQQHTQVSSHQEDGKCDQQRVADDVSICIAEVPSHAQGEALQSAVAAEVAVQPKQALLPKWKQNRTTRSAKKRGPRQASPTQT